MSAFLTADWWRLGHLLLWLLFLRPNLVGAQVAPTFDLAKRVIAPVTGNGSGPLAHTVAVDAAGNSYVSGSFGGPITFGTTTLRAGSGDFFVAKLDAAGSYQWIVPVNSGRGNLSSYKSYLAVDARGNVHVASTFHVATLVLGGTTLTNAGGDDLFVAQLDPNGNWLTAVRAGGAGDEAVSGLALDANGTAYVSGTFTGTTRFGTTSLLCAGGTDVFVARLETSSSWGWAVRGGGSGIDLLSGIGLDARGWVYTTGWLGTAGQLGSFPLGGPATFVARLEATTGTYTRVTTVNTTGTAGLKQLATAANGECYVAGEFFGTVRFGNTTFTYTGPPPPNNGQLFVAKLDTAGAWQWATQAGGSLGEACTGLAVDARGQTYLTGTYRGPGIRFGPLTLAPLPTGLSSNNVFVAQLDAVGNWRWAVPVGGGQEDFSTHLVLGPFATPTLVGNYFSSSMIFGALTVPGDPRFESSTFLARLPPNELRLLGDSILCPGTSSTQLTATTFAATPVSWRWSTGATTASITVTQPGTYTVTATFVGGYSLTEQVRVQRRTPSAQITGAASALCPGTPRQLTAVAPGAGTLRWSTGATTPTITVTQPGTYSVVATYSATCSATAQVSVISNELHISGRQQLCPGQSTTLTASTAGSPVTAYQWDTGATTPTLLVGQAGTYRVTTTLADGCQLTATHTVGPPVAKVATVSGDTLLCPGATLTLTARNPDALSYQWTTGATTPTIPVTQPGRYGVLLTFAGGCASRDSLVVAPAPVAPAFTFGADTTLCLEQPLLLRAPAFSGPGVTWRWSDGSTGPSLLVNEPGIYSLQLSTPCGSRTVSRGVSYISCLRIPNVITPNEDQRNDRFVIEGLPRGDWALTLYNRWGRQVYQTHAYHHEWGAGAAPGLYYYQLRHATTKATYQGWLEVIR